MQFPKGRPPTVRAERKAKGNRRLRKMNGVGWLQKRTVCGKIDSYGAPQGHFQCKSGRECRAGGRFHVLVSQRLPSGFAFCTRTLLYRPLIFHTARAFHRPPMTSHAMRSFTSNGGDFTHRAFFSIERRWFCVLYAYSFTSLADDFARRACSYTKGREKYDFK